MTKTNAFEQNAREYDTWFEKHTTEYALELAAIKLLLPESGTGFEVGAGTGRFTKPLSIDLGIEPSAAMRGIAVKRGVNIIDGTAESLPIDNNAYDYALFVTTVCFLNSLAKAFKEVQRVLKNNGFIIIGYIDNSSPLGKKYQQNKTQSIYYKDAIFHAREEIETELKNAGFSHFEYAQALLPGDTDSEPAVKPGYGEGSFVVLRAEKISG